MKKKRALVAVVAATATLSAVAASAASLGGLNSTSLGSSATVVASCDTDGVGLAYGTGYAATPVPAGYKVNTVVVSGIAAACNGLTIKVTLADGTNVSLGEVTGTVAGTSWTSPAFGTAVDAVAVQGAAVVIA